MPRPLSPFPQDAVRGRFALAGSAGFANAVADKIASIASDGTVPTTPRLLD
jgi:hypothetical protein